MSRSITWTIKGTKNNHIIYGSVNGKNKEEIKQLLLKGFAFTDNELKPIMKILSVKAKSSE